MVKNTRNPLRINNPARYVRASRWQNGGPFGAFGTSRFLAVVRPDTGEVGLKAPL